MERLGELNYQKLVQWFFPRSGSVHGGNVIFNKNYSWLPVEINRKNFLQIYKIKEVTPLSLKKSAKIFFKDRQCLICVDITHPSNMGGYNDVIHMPQGVILRKRLGPENIQGGPGNTFTF